MKDDHAKMNETQRGMPNMLPSRTNGHGPSSCILCQPFALGSKSSASGGGPITNRMPILVPRWLITFAITQPESLTQRKSKRPIESLVCIAAFWHFMVSQSGLLLALGFRSIFAMLVEDHVGSSFSSLCHHPSSLLSRQTLALRPFVVRSMVQD